MRSSTTFWRGASIMARFSSSSPSFVTMARHSSPPQRSATMRTLPPSLFVSTKSRRWKSWKSFNVIKSHPSADSSQPLVSTSTIVSARMPKNVAASANSWMAMFLRSPSAFRSKHSARSSFA